MPPLILDHPSFALPATVADAVAALAGRPGAAYVAGGTELMPDLLWRAADPAGFVSLRRVGSLRRVHDDGSGDVRVGAGVTIAALTRAGASLPGLARAAGSLGTPLVRTQATVGGNVMSALPYRNLLPVLLATGARVELTGPDGVRTLPFDGFVTAPGRTRALAGELLTAVLVPRATGFQDFVKVGPRNAQFVATASAAIDVGAGTPPGWAAGTAGVGEHRAVRLAFGNAAGVPLRVPEADEFATRALATDDPAAAGALAAIVRDAADPPDDHVASADYRRHALGVLAGRLLERARGARP
jgi:CO/xanthine dehydrogenase FAD-binding subunit